MDMTGIQDRARTEWQSDILPLLIFLAVTANETTLERWANLACAKARRGVCWIATEIAMATGDRVIS
jgi:hypothetical protein